MTGKSAAERQRAYRERKRQELEDPTLPARDIEEDPEPEMPEEVSALVSLEEYVAQTKAEAAAFADQIGETDAPHTVGEGVVISDRRKDRIARAEKYARWRYQGVLDGEVERL